MKKSQKLEPFHVYASLPFVELAQEASIQMGPVFFWPASKFKQFIASDFHECFQHYLESISQVKAQTDEKKGFINTVKLALQGTTYVSIEKEVAQEEKELLLIDSLYLLYFACTFRNLYYNSEIPPFGAFRKIIPASLDFIHYKPNWEHLHINEMEREETVCVHLFDSDICNALGKMLSAIYLTHSEESKERIQDYKRIIRAIRYLVDRFFQRFVNLFEKGLSLPEIIFEPEDVIFLASSFEALFDINDRHITADFKQKLRPLLHIKYSRPLELFWKWVDDFYEVRGKIVHGGGNPDPIFRLNPNFEISHILIGIKLFIYSVYYYFLKYQLLPSATEDPYTPPDFKWIHPEEVLLFFWTESHLLHKLALLLTRIVEEKTDHKELFGDVHHLASLFISMQERYYQGNHLSDIKFIPSPLHDLQAHGTRIADLIEMAKKNKREYETLFKILPLHFMTYLTKRLLL